ncbi:normocyte-binding protein (plasmid) [Clostridium botulinum]|uniref:hypothetical protein n=1 Tax=Clostridium botulinum TaxID=1491 RepID=UPI00068C256F|nr:hypothetical protein [Clostridium botulinum]MCD3235447.1 normocyte-binding protein [Clostridium botulinum D/C]MCD3241383.1 normocyte-binding protein [Clostridium botulinum D/C]MCD3268861.1 normocyte-binding protein [Clostridium botulinum D/C]MCD3301133.1 normocyte-binding protein [Clostridium botulinum D/C]MCD3307120.1 normocyte-binding protein [Clostridium botulinum D/C]
MINLREVCIQDIYRNYRKAASELNCFFRSTPFVSLKHYEDFLIKDSENVALVKKEILDNVKEDTLIILDLPLSDSLNIGHILNKSNNANLVLAANFMFHTFGLIGDKKDIETLINVGMDLKENRSNKYVFILDNNRYLEKYSTIKDVPKDKFNNQYELSDEDLPTIEILNILKIKNVFLYYKDLKEDIKNYVEYLRINKLNIIDICKNSKEDFS